MAMMHPKEPLPYFIGTKEINLLTPSDVSESMNGAVLNRIITEALVSLSASHIFSIPLVIGRVNAT